MANDEQVPVVPAAVPAPSQPAQTAPVAPVLSFSDKLSAGFTYLWKNDKVFLLVFGILIVIGYASGALMDMITNKSNSDVAKAKDQDAQLATKENDAKAQAASYEQQAKQAAADEPQVDEDWNVKK